MQRDEQGKSQKKNSFLRGNHNKMKGHQNGVWYKIMKKTVAQLKKDWKLAEIAENGATITKIEIVREFTRMSYKCVDIASELNVGKSYISKIIKIVKYLDENGVALYDFKKWAYGRYNTVATLYVAISNIDKSETELNNPLDLLETKLNDSATKDNARGKKGASKKSNKKSAEKGTYITMDDKNGMVNLYHDGLHYQIPSDVLAKYLVKD